MSNPLENWDNIKKDFYGGSILLGNGFSIGCSNSFGYTSLYEVAKSKGLNSNSQKLFKKLQTTNFEWVLKNLITTIEVLDSLFEESSTDLKHTINLHYENIKNSLITTIQDIHPNYNDVKHKLPSVLTFLEPFKNIFTLNYDLLIYWAYGKQSSKPLDIFFGGRSVSQGKYVKFDNFNCTPIENNDRKVIYYLHGALFIYMENNEIRKITNTGFNILEQVTMNIQQDKYPLFVSEGDSQRKLDFIRGNYYLITCYKALRECKGKLVIFGHSLSEFDSHIYDAIKHAELSKIAVGIYENDQTDIEEMQTKANKLFKGGPQLIFYDSKTVPLWQQEADLL